MSQTELSPIINYIIEEYNKGTTDVDITSKLVSNGWSEKDINEAKKQIKTEQFGRKFYALYFSIFFLIIICSVSFIIIDLFSLNIEIQKNQFYFLKIVLILFFLSGIIGPILFKIFYKKKPSIEISILPIVISLLVLFYIWGFIDKNTINIMIIYTSFIEGFLISTIFMQIGNKKEKYEKYYVEKNFLIRFLINIYIIFLSSILSLLILQYQASTSLFYIIYIITPIIPIVAFFDILIPHITKNIKLIILFYLSFLVPIIFIFRIVHNSIFNITYYLMLVLSFFSIYRYNKLLAFILITILAGFGFYINTFIF
jgi:hypothetical protein